MVVASEQFGDNSMLPMVVGVLDTCVTVDTVWVITGVSKRDTMVTIDGDEILLVECLAGAVLVQSLIEAGDDSETLSHGGNLTLW